MGKHKDPSSMTRTHILKNLVAHGLVILTLQGEQRKIPEAHWLFSLTFLVSSRPVRDPDSKIKMDNTGGMTPEIALWSPHTHTDTHMHTNT